MVIVNLGGGLGNQLFQYAAGRYIAHKLNTEIKLDLTGAKISFKPKHHGYYRLGDFNIQENIATPEEVARVKATGIIPPPLPNPIDPQRDIFIQGHWFHGEEFFGEIADIIKQEFTFKSPLHEVSAAWEQKIRAAECSVALHIRHGDYINGIHVIGVIPLAYYETCMAEFKKTFPNVKAFVFSDDLDWARENVKLNVPTEFVEGCETDNEEFYLMSICNHTVIANSTFSWWAAWLNPNPDKRVFAPLPWSRSGLWDNGIPASWRRIPVDYEDLPVECAPLCSFIVYVKNNISNLMKLLSGIMSQTLKDYELILIDDGSTDGSEHLCRQVSLNKKVMFISAVCVGGYLGKARAWNSGLDFARGEYVLFLNGDDLILPNAIQLLCQSYSARGSCGVICCVQYMEENPAGDMVIGGVEGKRFVQRVDEQFKNANAPIIYNNDDLYQRLLMTGSRVFNPLIGTKFFRRDFLTENALRFNEKGKTDFELIFVAAAFMMSQEVFFAPNTFYVAPRK